ncbi:hypothetical protein X736_31905 [Mesorhizobium sp. L2C089B000]|nr:hypothetical protein X736_31905 [Mesorhizobium sp. L2C089B000]
MKPYIQAARPLALQPIVLSADPAQYDYLAADNFEIIRVDTGDFDALIRECSRLRETYGIAGITSAGEDFYATAAKLSQHFKRPGPNPASIERCCDKFAQRDLLAQAGIPIPHYRLGASAADIENCAVQIGFPVILKPAVGSGSTGVRLCRNLDELAEHAAYLLDETHTLHSPPRILIEEFVTGPHYTADLMGKNFIAIAALTFDRPPHFVYLECAYPAVLTDEEHERVADISLRSLEALGLGWGPTNVELRWTTRGPVVIEVNPRLAGCSAPKLVRLAYGIDLVTEHIKLAIGEEWNLRKNSSETAAMRFLVADRDGTLNWVDGECRAADVPGVAEVDLSIQPKTAIVRKGDYRDIIGHVIAASPTRAGTEAILQRAVGLINWSIIPFSAPG